MSSLYRPTIPRHCRLHQTAEYDRCMRAQTLLRQLAENNHPTQNVLCKKYLSYSFIPYYAKGWDRVESDSGPYTSYYTKLK